MAESDTREDSEDEGEETPEQTKVDRGQKFHERSGGFAEVGKAMAILLVLGLIAYFIFIL